MRAFGKILVANRGEIACRILRTLRRMDIRSVAVFSEADRHAPHVREADESLCIGPAAPSASYLDHARILNAAQATGAEAVHPGYGFLSENPDFAQACEEAGIVFIGPTPANMRDFGLKHRARALAIAAGVPVCPGSGLLPSLDDACSAAAEIGFPLMLKSTAGGGGIGMRIVDDMAALRDGFDSVRRLAGGNFRDNGVFLEKFVRRARHIEVQVFGDGAGRVLVLGERDCSVQRRNQKVVEETPAPHLDATTRRALHESAFRLCSSQNYRSAGTCEFVFDSDSGEFFFLEVNTRLQVEHCVTEAVTGIDLVEWMIRLAAGDEFPAEAPLPVGHAMQVRLYAEDPARNHLPSCGVLTAVEFPESVRVDSWIEAGTEVTPHYDPLLAKIITHAPTRERAVAAMREALDHSRVEGIATNQSLLAAVMADPDFARGGVTTSWLAGLQWSERRVDVLDPGTHTTVQSFPGRVGYWEVGVPPSGPMDDRSFRMANGLVGNPEDAPALECTVNGPTLRFAFDARVSICGADMQPELDGSRVPMHAAFAVRRGQTLILHPNTGTGCRAYIAVAGGFDVPDYLGSAATFTLGHFGGHGGRILRNGDVLKVRFPSASVANDVPEHIPFTNRWEMGVLYGPHGAPDFFTEADIATFFASDWKVHYNSSRTGVRLIGPKPEWARPDGGEAGLHPSNIHDNAYAIGAVDFTGDMPVILGPDGPSLGGFVCPAVIVRDERWKTGQLRPGDTVRFTRRDDSGPVLAAFDADGMQVVHRQAGDDYVLIEYGPPVLDVALRLRAHLLQLRLRELAPRGIIDITPGIRSLQIHFDSRTLRRDHLLDLLRDVEATLPSGDHMEVPSRVVHLPLSWDDPATRLAIEKYMQSVRRDASWCPSNIEFIRRVNGLASVDQVREIVFSADYLVLGLGDVYLGAPVATPLDPRHRLVTTKYNPARTWTPENAVGIGGAYLCVYGMEGPGGYQFVGRTVQMWNRWRTTGDFECPWLLRHFDRIRFFPVSSEELLDLREDFPLGRVKLDIREESFRMRDYEAFLAGIAPEAAEFKLRQQTAFDAEREQWRLSEGADGNEGVEGVGAERDISCPAGGCAVDSHLAANVWKVCVDDGETVAAGDPLVILEAMKMEITVSSPADGIVHAVACEEGQMVMPGQTLVILSPSP